MWNSLEFLEERRKNDKIGISGDLFVQENVQRLTVKSRGFYGIILDLSKRANFDHTSMQSCGQKQQSLFAILSILSVSFMFL